MSTHIRYLATKYSALAKAFCIGAVALGGLAALNFARTKRAESRNPCIGRFITVDGVKLHFLDTGEGPPLVLIHGNACLIQDFTCCGLINLAAKRYRVLAFDRPGYGYSERPRSKIWSPAAQADLINAAVKKLSVKGAVVLGHSFGASVALALALKQETAAGAVVLASGYYYPATRFNVVMASVGSIPILGDILNYTMGPLLARLTWSLMLRKMFGPNSVPRKFKAFPEEMTFRPSQIRASSSDAAPMMPSARAYQKLYRALKMPAAIVAGREDRLVDPDQPQRLHSDISQNDLDCIPNAEHMVHQIATGEIMAAIDRVADALHK